MGKAENHIAKEADTGKGVMVATFANNLPQSSSDFFLAASQNTYSSVWSIVVP